jgi:hypothetical protein
MAPKTHTRTSENASHFPLPRFTTRRRAQRGAYDARGGMGLPSWGFLNLVGAPRKRGPGGKPRRGRRGTPFAHTADRAGRGG